MEGTTVGSLMESVTSVFNACIGMVADVGETIVGTPILLLFCLIPIVGLGVGLFRRLINVN